jgi:multicomponent Na+:H+ antiporter subunit F
MDSTIIYTVAAIAILIALGLAVFRALAGPTVFDRALAANAVGNGAIMLLAIVGFLAGRPEFLDIGILYALLNIIATLAVLKFFRYGDLGHAGEEPVD